MTNIIGILWYSLITAIVRKVDLADQFDLSCPFNDFKNEQHSTMTQFRTITRFRLENVMALSFLLQPAELHAFSPTT